MTNNIQELTYEEIFGTGEPTAENSYIKESLSIVGRLTCKKYVSEVRTEIYNYIDQYRTVRIVGGASLGKTYFVLNHICSHYSDTKKGRFPLIINFLNSVRDNQIGEATRNKTILHRLSNRDFLESDGKLKAPTACNIANFCSEINDENFLQSVSIIVIDEEHLTGEHSNFRGKNISRFIEFIQTAQRLNIAVLLMTATPLNSHFKCNDVLINLSNHTQTHRANFEFCKGLKTANALALIRTLAMDPRRQIVVMINKQAKDKLKRNLERLYGREKIGYISSKQQKDTDGETWHLIHNSELRQDKQIFVSTSFICEGVNINNTNEIVFVTFADEVEQPGKIIQLSHRLRRQERRIIIGYTDEKKLFFKPRTELKVRGEVDDKEKAETMAYNAECVRLFDGRTGSLEYWINYIECYTENADITLTQHSNGKGDKGRPQNDFKGLSHLCDTIDEVNRKRPRLKVFDISVNGNEPYLMCEDDTAIIKAPNYKNAVLLDEIIDLHLSPKGRGDKEIKSFLVLYRAVRLVCKFNEYNNTAFHPQELIIEKITNYETQRNNRINTGGTRGYICGDMILLNEVTKLQAAIDAHQETAERLYYYITMAKYEKPSFVWETWQYDGTENKTAAERMRKYRSKKKTERKPKPKAMTAAERMRQYRQRKKQNK